MLSIAKRPAAITIAALVAAALLVAPACSKKADEQQLATEALAAGIAAQQAGDLATASAKYREVLSHDPQNQYAYYNLGLIDQTNGAYASADSNYNLALSIDPTFEDAMYNLAIVKSAEGDSDAAIALYRQVIALNKRNAAAHLNLGFALIDSGQKTEGNAELAKAIQIDPSLATRIPSGTATTSTSTGSPEETSSP
jgi:tetratricopeptide (TPR) repeat protein